jgi:hypothetical protein
MNQERQSPGMYQSPNRCLGPMTVDALQSGSTPREDARGTSPDTELGR